MRNLRAASDTVTDVSVLASRTAYSDRDRPYPRITHACGPHLFAQDGSVYFDGACGSGSMVFGHGDKALVATLAEQAGRLSLFPSKSFGVEVVERYTAALTKFAPVGTSRVLCMSSGSDAVEAALKLALQYHHEAGNEERATFIGRNGSYHGNTLAGLSVGGFWSRRAPFEKYLRQGAKASAADETFCDACHSGHGVCPSAASVAAAIEAEGPETVAAVVLEPVVGAALSAVAPCPRYLPDVRAICDRYGVLLILDEVMTGFCRTGAAFASELWSVRPDITICGKAISGGYYPLSAILVDARVAEMLERRASPFQNGQTHACSPAGAAIGLAVIERLRDGTIAAASRHMGEAIRAELSASMPVDAVTNIRGRGLMLGFDIVVPDRAAHRPPGSAAALLQDCAIGEGLIVYPSSGGPDGSSGEHAMLLPPLNLETHHVDELIGKLVGAAKAYLERGKCQ